MQPTYEYEGQEHTTEETVKYLTDVWDWGEEYASEHLQDLNIGQHLIADNAWAATHKVTRVS